MNGLLQHSMDKEKIDIKMSCYAGYRSEETPRHFQLQDRHIDIVEIIDRWLVPDHRYFKVKDENGVLYILRHDIPSNLWKLILYDTTQLEAPR